MRESIVATQQERIQVRQDTLDGKVPKRVFIQTSFCIEAICQHAGVNLLEANYDHELLSRALDKVCADFYADCLPVDNYHLPAVYQIMGAKNWALASNGSIQHPEIETMRAEDYDELISAPYDTLVKKFLPRICENLNTDDPMLSAVVMTKGHSQFAKQEKQKKELFAHMEEKFGYAPGFVTGTKAAAPFDFLADQLRGFKGITMDVRRVPDKVEAAVNELVPLLVKKALPPGMPKGAINFMPTHMPTYINDKIFERLYWPSMKALIEQVDNNGVWYNVFAENDCTRFNEYFSQLPESTIIRYEYGEMESIKNTVGKRHVITGFYDPTITLTRSKEECIDAAKRLLDICARDGRYYFSFDKGIMDINSVNMAKLHAVLEWLQGCRL